jgi:outer membrane protein assembly factor BamD
VIVKKKIVSLQPVVNMAFLKKIVLFLVIVFIASCSDYSKLQKSKDLELKYTKAKEYFEKGDYLKASVLFEELMGLYKGTAKGEDIYYYYAQTQFEMGDYSLAGYYYRNFVRTYPASSKAEECAYMNAYCFYLNSPVYSLDQTDTKSAIREFQSFINRYPQSTRIKECNEIIDKLRSKLERKSYEIAKQYYNVGDYKSSIFAFNSTMKDFPETKYREELMFLLIKSNYLLAQNSIESKKGERYKQSAEAYIKFVDTFKSSKYLHEAESIYNSTLKAQEKIKS